MSRDSDHEGIITMTAEAVVLNKNAATMVESATTPFQEILLSALSLHRMAELFPLMEDYEFASFTQDIKQNGLKEPLYVDQEMQIIDGRHRFRACSELGYMTVPVRVIDGSEEHVQKIALAANLNRRHLSTGQKAFVAARLKLLSNVDPLLSALQFRIGLRSVERALFVLKNGCPEIQRLAERGVIATDAAAVFSTLPMDQQTETARETPDEIRRKIAEVRLLSAKSRPRQPLSPEQILSRYEKRIEAEVKRLGALPPSVAKAISLQILEATSMSPETS